MSDETDISMRDNLDRSLLRHAVSAKVSRIYSYPMGLTQEELQLSQRTDLHPLLSNRDFARPR